MLLDAFLLSTPPQPPITTTTAGASPLTTANLLPDLQRDEGFRAEAYPDPLSPLAVQMRLPLASRAKGWQSFSGEPWTVGHGHTGREVHQGLVWTPTTALAALVTDVGATEQGLDTALPWWRTLEDIRQDCLANQAFNLGVHRFMGFNTYLGLVKAHQFAEAADDDLHTLWAHQVGDRAVRIAEQMRTGQHAA